MVRIYQAFVRLANRPEIPYGTCFEFKDGFSVRVGAARDRYLVTCSFGPLAREVSQRLVRRVYMSINEIEVYYHDDGAVLVNMPERGVFVHWFDIANTFPAIPSLEVYRNIDNVFELYGRDGWSRMREEG